MAGRQYGSVRKLAKGKWQVRTTVGYSRDGRQLTKSETVFGNKARAEKVRQALVYTYHPAYREKPASGWTVGKALEAYEEAHAQVWTSNGRATRSAHAKKLKVLHKTPLLVLSVKDLEELRNWLLKKHEPSYVRSILGTLSSCLAWAVKRGEADRNVADGIKVPMSRKKATAPSSEDVSNFLSGIKADQPRLHAAFRLAAVTGARRQEIVGLQWGDIAGKKVTFRRSVAHDRDRTVRESLKSSEIKVLAIDGDTVSALRAARNDDLWVFGDDGRPWRPDKLSKAFRILQAELGIDIGSLHGLRHYQASVLFAKGASVVEVAHRLGHKKVSTTMDVYAHLIEPDDQIADLASAGL